MNLKRVSIRNEILIRDVSIINSISCKNELNLKCRSGLKLSLDSRKLPLAYLIFNPDDFYGWQHVLQCRKCVIQSL